MKKFAWVALLAASLPVIHGCAAVAVGGAATVAPDNATASAKPKNIRARIVIPLFAYIAPPPRQDHPSLDRLRPLAEVG